MNERGLVPPPGASSVPGAPAVVVSYVPVVGSHEETREFWIRIVPLMVRIQMMPAARS